MDSYFIQRVIITYYDLFDFQITPDLAKGSSCVLLPYFQYSLSTSLFSGTLRCSGPILHFPTTALQSAISPESVF